LFWVLPPELRSLFTREGRIEVPSSQVLTFTDPVAYQSAIRAADIEVFPTAKGEFHAELTQVSLDRLWIQRAHERLPRVYVGSVNADRKPIGFLTRANQPAMQHRGMDVAAGDIIVNNADLVHRRTEAHCDWGSMSLTPGDLNAACQAITGQEFSGPSDKLVIRPRYPLMSRLMKLHEVVGQLAKTTPAVLELPEVARALEQELIHLMVRCLTEGVPSGMTAGGRRHDAIVARFEEFLEANPDQPLYLTEICGAIAVSERTLRVACEEHLGLGPIRYLSLRRMHLVRRALLRADPSTATVTRLATDHGFWELGRFAVTYRALFGETPSESLRRPLDGPRISLNRPSSLESPVWHS
jgi:AraC-like DNA-binding protein